MDNERKVVLKESATKYFLDDLNINSSSEKHEYILENEFRDSRKKRNWNVVIILMLLSVFLALTSWGITKWFESKNKIRNYELDEFLNVDLLSILNEAEKAETQLKEEEAKLISSRVEYEKARQLVIETSDQKIHLLENRNLSDSDFKSQKRIILNQRETELKSVDDQYQETISVLEESVKVLTGKLESFDSGKIKQAQEFETAMNNEKQKYQLEKEKLVADYEQKLRDMESDYTVKLEQYLKYQKQIEETLNDTSEGKQSRIFNLFNPTVTDENIPLRTILDQQIDEPRLSYNLSKIDPLWIERGYVGDKDLVLLENYVSDWRLLIDFVKKIPFENDVPSVLQQMEFRYLNTVDQVFSFQKRIFEKLYKNEKTLAETVSENRQYKSLYKQLSYSLIQKLKDSGGQGFILESGEEGNLIAFLDPFLEIPSETTGTVFGGKSDVYAGKVRLTKKDLFYSVEILNIEEDHKLEAFDRIFLGVDGKVLERSDTE